MAGGYVLMSWNWDHLRFFLALADRGTLTLAARELEVSHTTVLRRIKSLEHDMRAQLFDHHASGYSLTKAGDTLYTEALKMKHAIDSISRDVVGQDEQIGGDVVITTTDTLGFQIFPQLLIELQQSYPELHVTLDVINSMADISKREADIAVRTCLEPPENLIGRRLGTLRFSACASADYAERHALTAFPSDVSIHHFIVLGTEYRDVPFYQWLDSKLTDNAAKTTVSGFIYAYALCKAGLGITVLPTYLIDDDDDLVSLPDDASMPDNDLWMLSHVDLRDNVRVRMVRNFLYEKLVARFPD